MLAVVVLGELCPIMGYSLLLTAERDWKTGHRSCLHPTTFSFCPPASGYIWQWKLRLNRPSRWFEWIGQFAFNTSDDVKMAGMRFIDSRFAWTTNSNIPLQYLWIFLIATNGKNTIQHLTIRGRNSQPKRSHAETATRTKTEWAEEEGGGESETSARRIRKA